MRLIMNIEQRVHMYMGRTQVRLEPHITTDPYRMSVLSPYVTMKMQRLVQNYISRFLLFKNRIYTLTSNVLLLILFVKYERPSIIFH